MLWLITKYSITAFLVVLISEVAKRSDKMGSLIAALPTVTLLTLIWLYVEKQPADSISNHAWYTFWYVLPTLPMFLVFPLFYRLVGFWFALLLCGLLTAVVFVLLALVLNRFGIRLW